MTTDTAAVLAAIESMRARVMATGEPVGLLGPRDAMALLAAAEAAARLRQAQADWVVSALGGYDQLNDTAKIVEAEDALDAALARLAGGGE